MHTGLQIFPMSTQTSWSTVIALFAFVGAGLWLMRQIEARRAYDEAEPAEQLDVDDAAAPRHLSLVADAPQPAPQPLYDWRTQGL